MYFHRKETFRFLTLTSSQHSQDMRSSWKELVKRIRRLTPAALLLDGYLTGDDMSKYDCLVDYMTFEYFAVFTDEGLGVVHCVYAGDYLPFQWLQDTWIDIHSAYGVNIKKVKTFTRRKGASYRKYRGKPGDKVYYPAGLAGYMLNQYLRGQNAIRTINHSRGWVYPGFVDDWTRVKRAMKNKSLDEKVKAWHYILDERKVYQENLDGQKIIEKAVRLLEGRPKAKPSKRRAEGSIGGQGRESLLFGGVKNPT